MRATSFVMETPIFPVPDYDGDQNGRRRGRPLAVQLFWRVAALLR
jgi:hypothetical protein